MLGISQMEVRNYGICRLNLMPLGGGDDSVDYGTFDDDDKNIIAIKDDAVKTKGYFIYPSQLFKNVVKNAKTNESLNTDLAKVFTAIESSCQWLRF
ncbi:MAG: hypothetical protein Q9M40_10480 [Sulfurimonas sp.]|nr:hypothetical protein [Sulfurimonas sp.]